MHDPERLRLWSTRLAALVIGWSALSTAFFGNVGTGPLLAALVPMVTLLAWRLPITYRSRALTLIVAGFATYVPEADMMLPALSAVIMLAIVDDTDETPWVPWVGGLIGSIGSLFYDSSGDPGPFIAVAIGGGVGLLARSASRAGRLEQEAGELRGQAAWLEQRTALARELHDVVGHHVTAMVVQAEAGLVGGPERALREIGTLGRTALGELDALVVGLRDPDAPLTVSAPPRLADVDELLAAPLRAQGVDVQVRIQPDLELDEVQVLGVYRITQESLTNVARHAHAGAAWVEVLSLGEHLRVRVTDDGVGPPAAADRGERGSGLVGIGERVAALGGFWELGERLGGGTVLDVVLPLTRVTR